MEAELIIRRRRIGPGDLELIRRLILEEGHLGRSHISNRLCDIWDWRQANGHFRQIACRDLLRRFQSKALIELPAMLGPARRTGYRNALLEEQVSVLQAQNTQLTESLAAYLKGRLHGSYTGVRDFLQDVVGVKVSRGYVAKLLRKAGQAFGQPHGELIELLTVMATCALHKQSPFEWICRAISAYFKGEAPPSLIPDSS